MDMESILTNGFCHSQSGFRQQEQPRPVSRYLQFISIGMSGKGEVGFRLYRKDGQLFIIQLNGQCFGFHRLYPTF